MFSRENKSFVLVLVAFLLSCQAAMFSNMEFAFCVVSITLAGLYLIRRPSEALWVGFLLLAIASQLYPVQVDELGTSVQGTYRVYILAVGVVAASTFVGLSSRSTAAQRRILPQCRTVRYRIVVLATLFLLALAYCYFTSAATPQFSDVLRDCSGLITLLVFIFLGFVLSPSLEEIGRSFARLCLCVLAYSAYFVLKFLYLSRVSGTDQTTAIFSYSQRDLMFFSGLVFVVLVAQVLSSEIGLTWLQTSLNASMLLLATLFSGSRSVLVCELLVSLLFIFVWRSKIQVRSGLLAATTVLALFFGLSSRLPSQLSSQGGVLGYVSSRYLMASGDDTSLLARASEMGAVADAIREHPLFGRGPLASYSFFDPLFGWKETTFLDTGLGYLLMKTGIGGTAIFFWFAIGWLRMAGDLRKVFPTLTVASLASFIFYVVFMPFGPSFFEFQHSWLIGLVIGGTVAIDLRLPDVQSPWPRVSSVNTDDLSHSL